MKKKPKRCEVELLGLLHLLNSVPTLNARCPTYLTVVVILWMLGTSPKNRRQPYPKWKTTLPKMEDDLNKNCRRPEPKQKTTSPKFEADLTEKIRRPHWKRKTTLPKMEDDLTPKPRSLEFMNAGAYARVSCLFL